LRTAILRLPLPLLRREQILVQSIPAAEKARSASTDVGGLSANESTRAVNATTHTAVSDFLPNFNSFLFTHAFLCSTDTRNLNPSNPDFCPHTNPGLRVENGRAAGLPGFSDTQVAFPKRDYKFLLPTSYFLPSDSKNCFYTLGLLYYRLFYSFFRAKNWYKKPISTVTRKCSQT